MADLKCDFCEVNDAAFMVGNLDTGEQTAACPGDMARLGLSMAKALLPPEEILTALGFDVPAPAAEAEAANGGAPKSKRKGGKAPKPEPQPAPTEALAEGSPAATDG